MHNYYCKNCNNLIGEWDNKYKYYEISNFCSSIKSKNNESIYFLNCKNCKKFVGINCNYVCENCFGKDKIYGEKNLYKWFLEFNKIKIFDYYKEPCDICCEDDFRWQFWFFKELTFYK